LSFVFQTASLVALALQFPKKILCGHYGNERYLEPMRSLQVTAGDFIQIELALATG
jgi:hypothetical protein